MTVDLSSLSRVSLLSCLQRQELAELETLCHRKTYKKSRHLFLIGDRADSFCVILEGWVRLYRVSREGEEITINVFGPSESFAEAAVFSDRRMFPANAQAVDDVTVLEVPRQFFIDRIERDSSFALRVLGAIAARQIFLIQQLEQVTTRNAPQRIGAFLLRFCRRKQNTPRGPLTVELPYDKSLISTRLNIKPETFSRALAKLKPYGVSYEGRAVLIEDPEALAEYCDFAAHERPF